MDLESILPQLRATAARIARTRPDLVDDLVQEGWLRAKEDVSEFDPSRCTRGEAGLVPFLVWRSRKGMIEVFWRQARLFPLSEREVRLRSSVLHNNKRVAELRRRIRSSVPCSDADLDALRAIRDDSDRLLAMDRRNQVWTDDESGCSIEDIASEDPLDDLDEWLELVCLRKRIPVWLSALQARDRRVVELLWLEGRSREHVALEIGVTAQRVSQLWGRAQRVLHQAARCDIEDGQASSRSFRSSRSRTAWRSDGGPSTTMPSPHPRTVRAISSSLR